MTGFAIVAAIASLYLVVVCKSTQPSYQLGDTLNALNYKDAMNQWLKKRTEIEERSANDPEHSRKTKLLEKCMHCDEQSGDISRRYYLKYVCSNAKEFLESCFKSGSAAFFLNATREWEKIAKKTRVAKTLGQTGGLMTRLFKKKSKLFEAKGRVCDGSTGDTLRENDSFWGELESNCLTSDHHWKAWVIHKIRDQVPKDTQKAYQKEIKEAAKIVEKRKDWWKAEQNE